MEEKIYVKSLNAEDLEKEISAVIISRPLRAESIIINYSGKVKEYSSKETEIDKIKADLEKHASEGQLEYSAELVIKFESNNSERKPSSASPLFDDYPRLDSIF